MNSWNFTGNLGQDCRSGNAGDTPVVNFSVASTSGFGDKKVTTWVDCAYWGKRALAVQQYLVKGQQVAVTGEHSTREHDGKTYTTCRVENVSLIGGNPNNQQQGGGGHQKPTQQNSYQPPVQQQNNQQAPTQQNNGGQQNNNQGFNNQMSNQGQDNNNQPRRYYDANGVETDVNGVPLDIPF